MVKLPKIMVSEIKMLEELFLQKNEILGYSDKFIHKLRFWAKGIKGLVAKAYEVVPEREKNVYYKMKRVKRS